MVKHLSISSPQVRAGLCWLLVWAVARTTSLSPTAFFSRVSTDAFGDALLRRLEESGVDTSLVQRGPEPTMLAVVTLDEDSNAHYSFYAEGTADRLVTDPGPLPDSTEVLSVGTLGMALQPCAQVYEAMLRRESRQTC